MMTRLEDLSRSKLILQKTYHCQEDAIDKWPFWMLEQNIKIVNQDAEEEEKRRKSEEDKQKSQMPNLNTSSMMKDMNSMAGKFKT